ncbi:shikimate kinase [Bacillus sp. 03113]|uniref:shikimate kinase n=1 Tax=Bacillus sp. 03113 TaxID=2578211 RepID=UPI0011428126|nr:shikimate kinase [Bacillus sp. 03113]
MKSIYLIGFMGAGKTTVGEELGSTTGLSIYDVDQEIVNKAEKTINEIFAESGEEHFRQLETEALQGLPKENAIIMTGGGIIKKLENRQFLKQHGTVVFLEVSIDEVIKRLENDQTRPLIKGANKEKIQDLYSERYPLYKDASHFTIDTTGKEIAQIVREIKERL